MDNDPPCLPGISMPTPSESRPGPEESGTPRPAPRLKPVDRSQLLLRPVVVERLVAEDHPVRAIWEFVGRLDLSRYHDRVRSVEGAAGRPAFDPRVLITLWIYSYSQGVSSARAIERLCDQDPAYQWVTGLEPISAHTLSDFRVDHADALRELFVQVLALLRTEGLIALERVMQDGTRVKACAASKKSRRRPRIEQFLAEARETVARLEEQSEEQASLRQERARERAAREKQARLEAAVKQFAQLEAAKSRVDRVSTTDPESRVMKFADGGTGPAYNVQVSTDAVHSLIVGIDVSHAGSDYQQLAPAVDRLERTTGDVPDQMVVDGGYISSENVLKMAERGVDLIGPESEAKAFEANQQKSYDSRGVKPAYETSRFGYHAESDTYICPEGERLTRDARYEVDGKMLYRYRTAAGACDRCWAKAMCCPRSRHGRSVERREELPAIAAFREKMQTDEARAVYRTRSQVAEFPNLWIKAKLGLRQFRLRGLVKVGLEALWCALTYDIQRAIRLLGQRRRFGAVSP